MILATIDLGSNSFHMLIVRVKNDGTFQFLAREKQKVQLRSGLQADGSLDDAAQSRALRCFKSFSAVLQKCKPDRVKVVGTYTLRSAKNIDGFLKKAECVLGYPIEVISGLEEARLIYVGVTSELSSTHKCLVVDIGGGSTEVVIGQSAEIIHSVSLDMGCVSFQNQFFSDKINAEDFTTAINAAKEKLKMIAEKYTAQGWAQAFGSSGTAQAISGIMQQKYGDGVITLERLYKLKHMCEGLGDLSDLHIEGLRQDRESILPGGLSILIAAFEVLGIGDMQVSKAAIREGVMRELLQR